MNRSLFLTLMLIGAGPFFQQTRADYDPIYFNSTLLSLVDGKPFMNTEEIFRYAKNLIMIRIGGKSLAVAEDLAHAYNFDQPMSLKEGNKRPGRIGLIPFKDEYLTIEELAKIEAEGTDPDEVQKSLITARIYFDKLSEDYVARIQIAKEYMVKLIDQWSVLRHSPNTLLLNWSKLDCTERESMHASLTSFKILHVFLGDLLLFLADLMHNCPKSLKKYRDSLKARGTTTAAE